MARLPTGRVGRAISHALTMGFHIAYLGVARGPRVIQVCNSSNSVSRSSICSGRPNLLAERIDRKTEQKGGKIEGKGGRNGGCRSLAYPEGS